jgi:hypothetical protein
MSLRPRPSATATTLNAPAAPIEFKQDFTQSTAALAASHDETVRSILSRLDSLQSKVAGAEETKSVVEPTAAKLLARPKSAVPSKPLTTTPPAADLHARVSQLEAIHQDHLERLGAQLNAVEDHLLNNGTDNPTINEIAAKFGKIEKHILNTQADNATINEIASKFDKIEGHVRTQTQLHDRIRGLETEVASLRRVAEPHPDQERLLYKINARLDDWERSRSLAKSGPSLGARVSEPLRSNASPDRAEYLASRIDKLKELRSKYES